MRCRVAGWVRWQRRVRQLGIVLSGNALLLACAPAARYEAPGTLRSYEILITRRDSLALEIARGLRSRGFSVRSRVKGGSRPTVYLVTYTLRETEPLGVGLTWLHLRLADTRTGAIVAAVSAPLDSLGSTTAAQARALVDSLAAQPSLRRPLPPS